MSLDEPEPIDGVLTFLSGYDTLEYSWVKAYDDIRALGDFIRDATRRQQAFWRRYWGTESTLSTDSIVLISFSFSFLLPLPPLPMGKLSFKSFSPYGMYSPSFLIFFLLSSPPISWSNPLSTTFLLLWSSSLSHHHLPHLTMNSTQA